jgi:tyrosyl-tRNA synthetase
MEIKKQLARELTSVFYGDKRADEELCSFSQVFSKGEDPNDMPEISISQGLSEPPTLINILSESGLFESKGQIRRLIKQGAVKLEGEKVDSPDIDLATLSASPKILKAGKKIFLRIKP